jgi:hypothetical protein
MSMGLAVWRDISLLWLILLSTIAILPFAVLFFFAIKGMRRLRQLAITFLTLLQDKSNLMATKTDEISRQVVKPIINARAKSAQVNGIRNAIFSRRQSR